MESSSASYRRIAHLRREWRFKNYATAMRFLDAVAEVAETQQHHPNVHLEGFQFVRIEVFTHSIGSITRNDAILAAKIDAIDTSGMLSKLHKTKAQQAADSAPRAATSSTAPSQPAQTATAADS
jgi:pterin-4a-carbinolamine dehydratase